MRAPRFGFSLGAERGAWTAEGEEHASVLGKRTREGDGLARAEDAAAASDDFM